MKPWERFPEASLAVLRAKRRLLDANMHVLNICVIFLGQWISVEFNREGSEWFGFGAGETKLMGLQAYTAPQTEYFAVIAACHVAPCENDFFKSNHSNILYSSFSYMPFYGII